MRALTILTGTLLSLFALVACASEESADSKFQKGVHYVELDVPVRTNDPSKIEVQEVFWYGCGHCYNFEPTFQLWAQQQADDVDVQKTHVVEFNFLTKAHARAFYAAKALKVMDKVHQPIFDELKTNVRGLQSVDDVAELFADNGVSASKIKKLNSIFESFGMDNMLAQADARVRGYGVTGTPTLIVDGRYRVVNAAPKTEPYNPLEVVNYLVDSIRAERSKAAAAE